MSVFLDVNIPLYQLKVRSSKAGLESLKNTVIFYSVLPYFRERF